MTVTVRLQARLPSDTHKKLSEYADQEDISLNSAMINLLDFALSYAKKGENSLLDETLVDFESNLKKVRFIINEYLINDAMTDFAKENKKYYLDYISERFTKLNFEEQKLLSDLVHALANKE